MNLHYTQVKKIKSLVKDYQDLEVIVTSDKVVLENSTHTLTITTNLEELKGHVDLIAVLSKLSKRNKRLELAPIDDLDYVDANHIASNPELRFSCDFVTVNHYTTNDNNSKTLLETNTFQRRIFTGNHFDLVLELLKDSPVRYFKRNYPELYHYLEEIESSGNAAA